MATSIAITTNKGGVGKTTLTINMAEYYRSIGKQVLIIDVDPQANCCLYICNDDKEVVSTKTKLIDIMKFAIDNSIRIKDRDPDTISQLDDIVLTSFKIKESLMYFMMSDPDITAIEDLLKTQVVGPHVFKILFQYFQEKFSFDYILVDCPPSLTLSIVQSIYNAVDYILIPTEPSEFGYKGATQALTLFQNTKTFNNPNLKCLGIIMTKYQQAKVLHSFMYSEMKSLYEELMFDNQIPLLSDFEKSIHAKQFICEYNKKGNASEAFVSFMNELEDRIKKLASGKAL